ncbi:RNA polymerase sigma factor [Leifsonia aquatica]|uniref:RNA polymerase sigma factor n=1 Tax=Leifsonia aquatica TaxID=144185 RepID=UPI0028AD38DC|nr:ECF-type sigma factor [Leifsonia aquatica]
MGETYNFGDINATDLATLSSVVKKRANRLLSPEDIEDVVSDILLDAVVASRKSGTPVVKLAFVYAKFPRYYSRAADGLMRDLSQREPTSQNDDESPVDIQAIGDFTEHVAVKDLVARLADEDRDVLVASVEGYVVNEIATAYEHSRSTTHRQLTRARQSVMGLWLAA